MKPFSPDALSVFGTNWALLTAGTLEHFNTMTIGWCGVGRMWNKPAVTVYVRESRYTLGFMDDNDYVTVSIYPKEYLPDLGILGKYSGRDCDKVAMTRLTPQPLEQGVTFAQASVTLLCKKMYRQFMDAAAMPKDVLNTFYKDGDIHYMYIGEVIDVIENAPVE